MSEERKYPKIYTAEDIKRWDCQSGLPDGRWIPARPYHAYVSIFTRLRIAYCVFTGKMDALNWEKG